MNSTLVLDNHFRKCYREKESLKLTSLYQTVQWKFPENISLSNNVSVSFQVCVGNHHQPDFGRVNLNFQTQQAKHRNQAVQI